MIHWAVPHLLNANHHLYPLTSSPPPLLTRIISVSGLPHCFVSLSSPLSLPLCIFLQLPCLQTFVLCGSCLLLLLLLYSAGFQPPRKPGPAQGLFLLKGRLPCQGAWQGVPALGFCLCKAPTDSFIVKGAIQISKPHKVESYEISSLVQLGYIIKLICVFLIDWPCFQPYFNLQRKRRRKQEAK